jgi:hypothetical protein
MHSATLELEILIGLWLFFLPVIIAMTRGRKGRDGELARSKIHEPDMWSFDSLTLSERSAEPKDQWVLGQENLAKSPQEERQCSQTNQFNT